MYKAYDKARISNLIALFALLMGGWSTVFGQVLPNLQSAANIKKICTLDAEYCHEIQSVLELHLDEMLKEGRDLLTLENVKLDANLLNKVKTLINSLGNTVAYYKAVPHTAIEPKAAEYLKESVVLLPELVNVDTFLVRFENLFPLTQINEDYLSELVGIRQKTLQLLHRKLTDQPDHWETLANVKSLITKTGQVIHKLTAAQAPHEFLAQLQGILQKLEEYRLQLIRSLNG